MPMAKGLFHKAVVQSGSTLRLGDADKAVALASAVLAELGLSRATNRQDPIGTVRTPVRGWYAAIKKLQPDPAAGGRVFPCGAARRRGSVSVPLSMENTLRGIRLIPMLRANPRTCPC